MERTSGKNSTILRTCYTCIIYTANKSAGTEGKKGCREPRTRRNNIIIYTSGVYVYVYICKEIRRDIIMKDSRSTVYIEDRGTKKDNVRLNVLTYFTTGSFAVENHD